MKITWKRVRHGLAYTWWESWTTPDWGWSPCQELTSLDKDMTFFPPESVQRSYHKKRLIEPICTDCPIRRECGEYAIEVGIPHGFWGGMDERERTEVRRRRAGGRLHGDKKSDRR